MHVIRLASPAPPLREHVRFYAQREVRVGGSVVVHPVTARAVPMIEFIFGDRFTVVYPGQARVETSPRTLVVGLQTHCRTQLHLQGTVECFVIFFQPAGLHRLFSVPIHELTDHAYETHSVLGSAVSRLEQRLGEAEGFEDRVRIADQSLLHWSVRALSIDGISAAARKIVAVHGNIPIAALAHDAGISMRQFERCFVQQVGVHPKLYARIVRFEAALESKARTPAKSWTDVAHEFGYYDQMHLVHDFQGFTGGTPTQILVQFEALFQRQFAELRSASLSEENDQDDVALIL